MQSADYQLVPQTTNECPNFGRNDTRVKAWIVSDNCTDYTLSGGNNTNNCAQSTNIPFTISQTLKDAPIGTYVLTAQGFYRQNDNKTEKAPVFFLGSKTTELAKQTGNETTISDASVSFTNKNYQSNEIIFYYKGNSDLKIGIRGTAKSQWVVWDNFQLLYKGPTNVTNVSEVVPTVKSSSISYDLTGRKTTTDKQQQCLIIKDGKKYLNK